jgi:hypothetical protein
MLIKKWNSILISEKRFYFSLIITIGLSLLFSIWFGLLSVERYLNKEPYSILRIIWGSLEYWAINQLVICVFAWVHFRILMDMLGNSAKERQLNTVRYGTLVFVVMIEIFSLSILLAKPIPLLIIYYTVPFTVISFVIVLLLTKILGLKRFDKNI